MDRDQGQSGTDDAEAGRPVPGPAQTEAGQESGFAAPSSFAAGPSLPYQSGDIPPAPQYNPYAQVPGAPAADHGGNSSDAGQQGAGPYDSQYGNPGYPGQQG